MKSFISLLLLLLFAGASYALDIQIKGTEFVKPESSYNYYVELLDITPEKRQQIKSVEYYWCPGGYSDDIFKEHTLSDKKEGTIKTTDFQVHSRNDIKTWPTCFLICIVTVTYNDNTTQSASDKVNVTMVP